MDESILRKLIKDLNLLEQLIISLLFFNNISVLKLVNLNLSDVIFILNMDLALITLQGELKIISGESYALLVELVHMNDKNENPLISPLFLGKCGRLSLNELWIITNKFANLISSTLVKY